MIPRLIRENLIECPKCKWKQDITNDVCPMCDFRFTKQQGSNVNMYIEDGILVKTHKHKIKFDINKVEINIPAEYISDDYKLSLKKNKIEFFNLIVNAEHYNKNDLLKNFDNIIYKINLKFIENERSILSVSVHDDLNGHEGFFTESDKKKLKEKYKKTYHDYYKEFEIENYINQSNSNFIRNEGKIMRKEFNAYLSNHIGIINDSDKEKLKKRYNKGYCNYYYSLNFNYSIDKKNEIEFNNRKPVVLKDFKKELNSKTDFISNSDRIQIRKKYMEYGFDYYESLNFDSLIDDFNKSFSKNKIDSLQELKIKEPSFDDIISKINFEIFSEGQINVEKSIRELDELIESPIFDLFSMDLTDEESSKLIIKIKNDITYEKVYGDITDILDFYFEQYKLIKKQILLNNFLNQYIKSDNFRILCSNYDLNNFNILDLIEKVRNDILIDDSMDDNKVIFRLEYYLKVESDKNTYFIEIDKIKSKRDLYLSKYNLTINEFTDILNYIQLTITQGHYIKDINECLINKIKQKIDFNRTESRIKLKKLVNDVDFIENNNLTQEDLEIINERMGKLIFRNEIRSNKITGDFLLKQLRRDYYGI